MCVCVCVCVCACACMFVVAFSFVRMYVCTYFLLLQCLSGLFSLSVSRAFKLCTMCLCNWCLESFALPYFCVFVSFGCL